MRHFISICWGPIFSVLYGCTLFMLTRLASIQQNMVGRLTKWMRCWCQWYFQKELTQYRKKCSRWSHATARLKSHVEKEIVPARSTKWHALCSVGPRWFNLLQSLHTKDWRSRIRRGVTWCLERWVNISLLLFHFSMWLSFMSIQ